MKVVPHFSRLGALANLRDLSAVGTVRLRPRLVYRSALLDAQGVEVIEGLNALGLVTIVDFRSASECRDNPSPWRAARCTHYWSSPHVPSRGNLIDLVEGVNEPAFGAIQREMMGLYREMPLAYADAFKILFQRLAEGQTPLLFHCSGGKDRTGVAAALLLTALGLPRDLVVADYIRTNVFDLRNARWMKRKLEKYSALGARSEHLLDPLLKADPAYLDAMFDEISSRYGRVEDYLRQALDVGDADLERVRSHLLEVAPPQIFLA